MLSLSAPAYLHHFTCAKRSRTCHLKLNAGNRSFCMLLLSLCFCAPASLASLLAPLTLALGCIACSTSGSFLTASIGDSLEPVSCSGSLQPPMLTLSRLLLAYLRCIAHCCSVHVVAGWQGVPCTNPGTEHGVPGVMAQAHALLHYVALIVGGFPTHQSHIMPTFAHFPSLSAMRVSPQSLAVLLRSIPAPSVPRHTAGRYP